MQIKSGCETDGSQEQGPQGDLGLCRSAMLTFSFLIFHSPGFTASAAPGERLVMIRECAESAMATVPSQALWVMEEAAVRNKEYFCRGCLTFSSPS